MTAGRLFLVAMCGSLALQGALARTSKSAPIYAGTHEYTAFDGVQYSMDVWRGDRVSVLTPVADRSRYDQQALSQLVEGLDGAFDYYLEATGRAPRSWSPTTLDGRDTVAAVASTCGAGCGYLGFNGIEIQTSYFNNLHDGIRDRNEFNQVPFYELGRNFWHYGRQLVGTSDPASFTTGYAVLMRFLSMEAAGVQGGPFRNWSFAEFRSQVEGLIDIYESNPAITFEEAFTRGVDFSGSGLGGTDLFASVVLRLGDEYGEDFLLNLWKEVERRPEAVTNQDALDNFVLAASYSAGTDLTGRFIDSWRWSISDSARQEAAGIGVPEPAAWVLCIGFAALGACVRRASRRSVLPPG